MNEKRQELVNPNSCLNKAADDEPIFVLRANDPLAPLIVDEWIYRASTGQRHSTKKLVEAGAIAMAMRAWKIRQRTG